ncbi:helix-turn-helix domain-containing protein [Nocardia sp. CA2R105]|uniref:PucR family transcriptional regulator n=1 Tax=Nocardia coffeae TaxID=2873381 RepID=UPI001CA756A1|nr:PucR family transcriptional regulator [Nocardia coffeae]MBY8862240.1 helix-turn-helix domain-containing protein [Nocardia coffeae]
MNQQLLSHPIVDGPARAHLASLHGLCALSAALSGEHDEVEILRMAHAAVPSLGSCRTLASYRRVDDEFTRSSPTRPAQPGLDAQVSAQGGQGSVNLDGERWGWAFVLRTSSGAVGSLVVGSDREPRPDEIFLLEVLAQLTGSALGNATMYERACAHATELTETNEHLAATVRRLEQQTRVHEVLAGAAAYGQGEQGIADALAQLTDLPVAVEDPFGNLRAWSGPGRPEPYPKAAPEQRDQLLHRLATHNAPLRLPDRVIMLVKPHSDVLGTVALIDPDHRVVDAQLFALVYGSTMLALELAHQRTLAEIELRLHRELVDDLASGTDNDSAYARAEALGHDLHGTHYVVVVHSAGRADDSIADAASRAASALSLQYIQGRHGGAVVLITDRRPDPGAFHHAIHERLDATPITIGISGRCEQPSDFVRSFADAHRAVHIRLQSRMPDGATAFEELGFYRLVDAAHADGQVDRFIHEWLGALLEYDAMRHSDLVHTLAQYLECGGNYNDTAAVLHIHRSTLRYRLGRIRELTGFDLRDPNIRFNLQAATRAWQFLSAGAAP